MDFLKWIRRGTPLMVILAAFFIAMTPVSLSFAQEADTDTTPAVESPAVPVDENTELPPLEIPPINLPVDVESAVPVIETGEITTEVVQKSKGESVPWNENGYVIFGIYLLIFILCGYFSNVFAKSWRMQEYATKFFIVSVVLILSVVTTGFLWQTKILGIDLSGGVVLIYDVKPNVSEGEEGEAVALGTINFDQLQRSINHRINPAGVKEISVQKYGVSQLKIVIPNVDAPEVGRIEKLISDAGSLEFRILASERFDAALISRAKTDNSSLIYDPASGNLLAKWVPLNEHEASHFINNSDTATRPNDQGGYDILVLKDPYDVTGKYLAGIREEYSFNQQTGAPERGVSFQLKDLGVTNFANLTRHNAPDPSNVEGSKRYLGIILSGELYSAPSLNSAIPNGRCQITFSQRPGDTGNAQLDQDIKDLIQVMEAGSLPADLSKEPISRMQTGSTLGEDTIRSGQISAALAIAVVLLFMVVYYRFCGVVACFAVVMNTFMIVAAMLTIKAAFTLAGLAGLVLTLGMAVDANILIYERLREELLGGATLKMAVRNAFSKASSAIIDSNVTTLIIALILYSVGTEQIKGFAITLFLGVLFNMFTAVYCTHVVFDVALNRKWLTKVSMLRILGKTRFDFMGLRKASMTIVMILFVVSFVATFARGKGIFDIDFVGGVSVDVVFKEKQEIADVRSKLSDLSDITVSAVNADMSGEEDTIPVAPGTRFSINTAIPTDREITAEDYLKEVTEKLKTAFGDDLYYDTITYEASEVAASQGQVQTVIQMTVDPSINYKALRQSIDDYMHEKFNAREIARLIPFRVTHATLTAKELEDTSKAYRHWIVTFDGNLSDVTMILDAYKDVFNKAPWFPASNTIGSVVADQARATALVAILASFAAIVIYLWFRFKKVVFGFSAVGALVANVIITLGAVAISYWLAPFLGFFLVEPFKISLTVIAAFLTVIGYTLNDTIVLFDRIREVRGKSPLMTTAMINQSTNEVLSRTILTSATTLFVVLVLYVFGGAGLHAFSFALAVGIVIGNLSSIFIAAPLLYWMIGKPGNPEKQNVNSVDKYASSKK